MHGLILFIQQLHEWVPSPWQTLEQDTEILMFMETTFGCCVFLQDHQPHVAAEHMKCG